MIFYFPIFQGKISKMPYCFLLSMDLNINWSLVIEKAWLARIWRFLYSVSYSRHTQNILLPNSFFLKLPLVSAWDFQIILHISRVKGMDGFIQRRRRTASAFGEGCGRFFSISSPPFFPQSSIYYYNNLVIPNLLPWRNSDD